MSESERTEQQQQKSAFQLHWRKALIAVSAGLLLIALLITVSFLSLRAPMALPDEGFRYSVRPGDSLSKLLDEFSMRGYLDSPKRLALWARLSGSDQKIHIGEYLFPAGTSSLDLLDLLVKGRVRQLQVTFPEGMTLRAALKQLSELPGLVPELPSPAELPEDLTELMPFLPFLHGYAHPEGLFFPDTYYYREGARDIDVLRMAHEKMRRVLVHEWSQRSSDLPYDDPYHALILASIVERETGLASERHDIAGVFVRRLQSGMRLETDPTTIYGLGSSFDGDLRRHHLRDRSNPYNTYRIKGLPPTPISLPGAEAIAAAVRPADGDALYFVARGDGSHAFSSSYKEHLKAVRRYQLQRDKRNYRSRPMASSLP